MNFELDEDQRLLVDSLARLFEAHGAEEDRPSNWDDYRDMGLLALPYPEASGGLGATPETIMLVMESYGRALARAPFLQSVLMSGEVLAAVSGELASQVLADLIEGRARAALCLYEPGRRYAWDRPQTRAEQAGDSWLLTGRKVAILDGGAADWLIVPASLNGQFALFLVAADAAGVSRHVLRTPDSREGANIDFDRVALPRDAMIGDPATAADLVARVIDRATAAVCAEAVGAMARLIEITTDYLNQRQQFGVPIGSFQALQHRAADMLVAMEQARSITFHAFAMLDASAAERGRAVAGAKTLVNRAARFVGSEAIQLHGGMGLAAEYPAGRYFQRLTLIETLFGDTAHMLDRVEAVGGMPD